MWNLLAFADTGTTDDTTENVINIWNDIKNFFTSNYWNILLFAIVLLGGIIVVKVLMMVIRKIFAKTKMEKIAQSFLCKTINFGLSLILILILCSMMGIPVSGLVTALSAIVLAIGMALQSNISNLANGIIIVSSHLFQKGDYVKIGDVEGSVLNINFMFTTLTTTDNKRVILPNNKVVSDAVINYGANPTRRVDFTFSVAYESDVEQVKKIVTDSMLSCGLVKTDPAPFCRLKVLGSSSLDFFANCWCDNSDYWTVYYYVTETVFNEFKRVGISVPYNQTEIRLRTDEVTMPVTGDGLPERVEKVEPKEKEPDLITKFVNMGKDKEDLK